jgi:hypothetical protein
LKVALAGGDRFGDLGAASLSTASAGFAGVSVGLSLSTGIAMDGDIGAVVISSSNKIAITIPL